MGLFRKEENGSNLGWLRHTVAIFFIFISLIGLAFFIFEKTYENRFYPKINIGGVNIGGSSKAEAKAKINQAINTINESGVTFSYKDKDTAIYPIVSSLGADIALPIINFKVDESLKQAFEIGRSGNFFEDLLMKTRSIFYGFDLPIIIHTEDEQIIKVLDENYQNIRKEALDASLIATTSIVHGKSEIIFDIMPEKIGFLLDYGPALEKLKENLKKLDLSTIQISANEAYPSIYSADCSGMTDRARDIIAKAPLTLSYEDETWEIPAATIADWLKLEKGLGDKVVLGINEEKVNKYITENLAEKINKEPINARLEVKDDRVVEFQTSKNGLILNAAKTAAMIQSQFLTGTSTKVEMVADIVESKIKTEAVNDLGIKEIIGTGHSNFAGSPKNRIHNITNGAEHLKGLLIAPDEEFSLISNLGTLDAEGGYLPELVIKGNRTIPEYGGGLCQIGTTVFRTALQSGLPITARRNHSYRVSYYEPAGTDATIYDPWPDLKFKNDTGHYILIQYRIDGNDLYFDFWGTRDGREVEVTDPTIYNIVSPGPTKMIETTDLAPGEKKCTESAHAGADAYFDYTVTYPETEPITERFSSHYVPWQAVCLIGVEKIEEEKTASSTPKN